MGLRRRIVHQNRSPKVKANEKAAMAPMPMILKAPLLSSSSLPFSSRGGAEEFATSVFGKVAELRISVSCGVAGNDGGRPGTAGGGEAGGGINKT